MRRVFSGVVISGLMVGCSVFGTSDPSPEEPAPGTPQDNAQPPPVDGSPIPGVYVSTSIGNDDGSGTAARPLKTLKKAFAIANEQHLRVIACAEVYEESLTLIDGVSAYGYYECAVTPWKRGERRAVVKAPSSPAVVAKGLRLPTRLEGFEVVAPDVDGAAATDETGSSIALEVRDSRELAISGSLLRGGKAAPGSAGGAGVDNSRTATSDGAPALEQKVGACNPMVVLCSARKVVGQPGGVTTCAIGPAGGPGGQGGDGLFWIGVEPNTVAVDPRGRPLAATADTAAGGIMGGFSRGLPGTPGTPGTQGADGVNGTWSLSAKGFVRGNGTAGGPGKPGQGGGGGGGTNAWFQSTGGNTSPPPANAYSETATGAGGGGGGCGGQPGTAGTGGGASVGAFIVASGVTIEQTRIESSAGGAAGRGNLGTRGTKGGSGGAGTVHTVDTTGKGGDGGPGGSGGGSGHGAAGPSIALVYSGARPILTGTELAPGPGGAGQPYIGRIVLGLDEAVVSAAAGESKQEHEIKP